MAPTPVAGPRLELLARKSGDEVRDLTFERIDISANRSQVVTDFDQTRTRFLQLLFRCPRLSVGIADHSTRVWPDLDATFDGQQPHRLAHRVGCRTEHHRQFAVTRKPAAHRVVLRLDQVTQLVG